jgi:hypothetical protein
MPLWRAIGNRPQRPEKTLECLRQFTLSICRRGKVPVGWRLARLLKNEAGVQIETFSLIREGLRSLLDRPS